MHRSIKIDHFKYLIGTALKKPFNYFIVTQKKMSLNPILRPKTHKMSHKLKIKTQTR
jgi:hypothetical protein